MVKKVRSEDPSFSWGHFRCSYAKLWIGENTLETILYGWMWCWWNFREHKWSFWTVNKCAKGTCLNITNSLNELSSKYFSYCVTFNHVPYKNLIVSEYSLKELIIKRHLNMCECERVLKWCSKLENSKRVKKLAKICVSINLSDTHGMPNCHKGEIALKGKLKQLAIQKESLKFCAFSLHEW